LVSGNGLFSNSISNAESSDLSGRMINEGWIGKDVEGSNHGLFQWIIPAFTGGTGENYEKPQSE
jgi:hypothetical protein